MAPETNLHKGNDTIKRTESPLAVQIPSRHQKISEQLESPTSPLTTPSGRPQLRKSVFPSNSVPLSQDGGVSSDKQLGSPGSYSDRVFPIRSVVSVDSSQTPHIQPGRNSSDSHRYFPSGVIPPGASGEDIAGSSRAQHVPLSGSNSKPIPRTRKQGQEPKLLERQRIDRKGSIPTHFTEDRLGGGSRMLLFNDAGSEKSDERADSASYSGTDKSGSLGWRTPADQESIGGLVTARFKHIVTTEGHAIITGRDGDMLQRCEDEPIHIPGAVQSFGLLVALEETTEGELIVRVVSENAYRMIGYTPQELFKLNSFLDILSEEQQDNLLDHIDFIQDEEADPASNGPEVFTISIRSPGEKSSSRSRKYWCAMHVSPSHPDLILCEFELDNDEMYPLIPTEEETPEPPEDTLHSNPTEEEYAESTVNLSKPLRVLRSARKRKGEAAVMEVFNIMSQVQEQLASAPNLDMFLKILVGVVKELTGFHRVMIYQFDSSFNGRVVTELVDVSFISNLQVSTRL